MTFHYPKVHLNLSMRVACYLNYREGNWTSQALASLYAVMKCSKASWEVPGHLEGVGSGPSLRLETRHLKSAGDCGSRGLPKSLQWGAVFPEQAQQLQDCLLPKERFQLFDGSFPSWIASLCCTNLPLSLGKKQCSLSCRSGWLHSLPPASSAEAFGYCLALPCKAPGWVFPTDGELQKEWMVWVLTPYKQEDELHS